MKTLEKATHMWYHKGIKRALNRGYGVCVVYQKKTERVQMTIEDFILPFDGKLSADNDWVKLACLMPWEMVEEIYADKFKNENPDGRPPVSARIAFGALHIKATEQFTNEKTQKNITENPYMQYFLGFKSFQTEPPFDLSMMVHFGKRFTAEDIAKINEELYRRTHPPKDDPPGDGGNKGTLVLDATCSPADVRYPTDLSLLNECRENVERLIGDIWEETTKVGHKTSYSRKKARGKYLKIAKQRKPKRNTVKKAVFEQLDYVERSLSDIDKLLTQIPENALTDRQKERINLIRQVALQQREHAENPKESIPDRIVNLRQPHVRPIMRGKAGKPVEFGQKLAISVVDGFTFIEEQRFDSFNEGVTLIESAKKYRKRHGVWPEAILADTIYRNRENRRFCKQHDIRLSGPKLGRPKAEEIEADKEQAYRDSCNRNIVESKGGIAKRRYGLDRIFAYLDCTAKTEAAMIIFAMNAALCLRTLLSLFSILGFGRIKRKLWGFS